MIQTDPRDAHGYAALADANAIMGDYRYGSEKPAVYFSRARRYARLALTLDPNSADAHAALGLKGRREIGLTDGMVRISVGIEDVEDLIADLEQALAGV